MLYVCFGYNVREFKKELLNIRDGSVLFMLYNILIIIILIDRSYIFIVDSLEYMVLYN